MTKPDTHTNDDVLAMMMSFAEYIHSNHFLLSRVLTDSQGRPIPLNLKPLDLLNGWQASLEQQTRRPS